MKLQLFSVAIFSVFVSCLLLVACSGKPASESGAGKEPQKDSGAPGVTASVKNLAEIDKLIAGHSGKVVVVDLWATW